MGKRHNYTRGERIADGALHILGVSAGIFACVTLFLANTDPSALGLAAIGLYSAGLLTMLGCSTLYNLAPEGIAKTIFRRLDHAAIFAMIAGTYTPIGILGIGGVWGWCLVAAVWVGALAGSTLKLAAPGRFEGAAIAAYLLLGWAGLVAIGPLTANLSARAIMLIALGGAFYSMGVLLHLATKLRYHNVLWHAFVLAGAGSHFAVVYGLVARTAP
ncbi:PAQR family membrane homeostasis protein TrhA [Neoroseomonas alba]|uniref:PAQR family membrane homeostasis protein TrhA n=1 Tax=Roseomonas alba TaxID=2846776 RepID=UPI002106B85E|nr:hemolysin III family protein [Neoroseomonas alba]